MSYIKRDVNIILLFLMVGIIAALIGITTYYQSTYLNLSRGYTSKINEYNQLLTNLEKNRLKLNETMAQFELKSEREKDLSEKYTFLRDENLLLSLVLNETNQTLQNTQESLEDTQDELTETTQDLTDARTQMFNMNQTIKSLTTKASIYRTHIFEIGADVGSAVDDAEIALASNSTTPSYYEGKIEAILEDLESIKDEVEYLKRLK